MHQASKGEQAVTYFHGGIPGLNVGDMILPPSVTGTTRDMADELTQLAAPHLIRPDMVYATTVQDVARGFAAMHPDGALYRVEMVGDVQPDPDMPVTSVMGPSARVVEVVKARVILAHRRLDSWARLMDDALSQAGELTGRRQASGMLGALDGNAGVAIPR